jgi:pyruvate/2-oxoglutarate dehydrogenase complex dihydrolipoamide acyltransferase (E2) component
MHSEQDERSGEPLGDAPSSTDITPEATRDTATLAANDDIPQLRLEDAVPNEPAAFDLASGGAVQTGSEFTTEAGAEPDTEPSVTLSPAVRRLVRQYDLDITGIHGTGPSGRIKVGDVIALVGSRPEAAPPRTADPSNPSPVRHEALDERPCSAPDRTAASAPAVTRAAGAIATTIFECDLTRVLTHRKQRGGRQIEVALASYFFVACREALRAVPEMAAGRAPLGGALSGADGRARNVLAELDDDSALGSIDDRLLAFDQALRARDASTDLGRAGLVLYHHGLAGSLLATPTPILAGQVASVGLGRVRKQIVVRTVDGEDAPRVAALCYVTLSFLEGRVDLPRANRFLGQCVRVLEHWPLG